MANLTAKKSPNLKIKQRSFLFRSRNSWKPTNPSYCISLCLKIQTKRMETRLGSISSTGVAVWKCPKPLQASRLSPHSCSFNSLILNHNQTKLWINLKMATLTVKIRLGDFLNHQNLWSWLNKLVLWSQSKLWSTLGTLMASTKFQSRLFLEGIPPSSMSHSIQQRPQTPSSSQGSVSKEQVSPRCQWSLIMTVLKEELSLLCSVKSVPIPRLLTIRASFHHKLSLVSLRLPLSTTPCQPWPTKRTLPPAFPSYSNRTHSRLSPAKIICVQDCGMWSSRKNSKGYNINIVCLCRLSHLH